MVMYYLPNFQQSQITLVQYLRAALAFRVWALFRLTRRLRRRWRSPA